MCQCRPEVRTPFCGRPGCEWPTQIGGEVEATSENPTFGVRVLLTNADRVLFDAVFVIEDNAWDKPLQVVDVQRGIVCHGAAEILKEAAFYSELVENGK